MGTNTVQMYQEQCSGCGVCERICPVQAIHMKRNEEGFWAPYVDASLCVACGQCVERCPMIHSEQYKEPGEPDFVAAKHLDQEVLRSSTSGGAFTALSDVILARGGVVYGVDFDDDLTVCHKRADSPELRDRMRFSKYVQSSVYEVFDSIRADLDAGREVLFTGTPCQAAAVRAMFGHHEKLILCDLICHGVPSPLLWEECRKTLEQEQGGKINWASFRNKEKGWFRGKYQIFYTLEGRDERLEDTRYYDLYLKGKHILRPSCYTCPYGKSERAADLTIADYWGIEKFSKEWYDPMGVSLILIRTERGRALLDACEQFPYESRSPEEAKSEQRRFRGSVDAPPDRGEFWQILREKGYAAAYEHARSLHPEFEA